MSGGSVFPSSKTSPLRSEPEGTYLVVIDCDGSDRSKRWSRTTLWRQRGCCVMMTLHGIHGTIHDGRKQQ